MVPELAGQLDSQVAGAAADDRQRRWLSLRKSLDPVMRLLIAGQLVPAKTKPRRAIAERERDLGHGRGLARESFGVLHDEIGMVLLQARSRHLHRAHEALPGRRVGG